MVSLVLQMKMLENANAVERYYESRKEPKMKNLSTICAHCTSNKNQHALMVFNGNRFRHTASSVQVN